MNTSTRVIYRLLGGTRRASQITGFPSSTIQTWKKSGVIPARRQAVVIEKARAAGIEIGPSDVIPASPEQGTAA